MTSSLITVSTSRIDGRRTSYLPSQFSFASQQAYPRKVSFQPGTHTSKLLGAIHPPSHHGSIDHHVQTLHFVFPPVKDSRHGKTLPVLVALIAWRHYDAQDSLLSPIQLLCGLRPTEHGVAVGPMLLGSPPTVHSSTSFCTPHCALVHPEPTRPP